MHILVRANQHDTLDMLLFRHQGSTAALEATLEMNRNTLGNNATLEHGQVVKLPLQMNHRDDTAIQLWD